MLGEKVEDADRVSFEIPAGVESGSVMEVSRGWDRVKVQIHVVESDFFLVSGADIMLRVPVTLKEWLDGTSFQIPAAYQRVQLELRSGIHQNKDLEIEGGGLVLDDGVTGDLIVHPFIVPPGRDMNFLSAVAKVVDAHSKALCHRRSSFLRRFVYHAPQVCP